MSNNISAKIWSFCDTLRDDGVGYGDYLEQLTYLLFLKMADENSDVSVIPVSCQWTTLKTCSTDNIIERYEQILNTLSKTGGMLGKIFKQANNRIYDPVKLKRLVKLIDEENWTTTDIDVKGEIYESLLQKNAENSGAGQYFTPRPVIQAIIECLKPKIGETISDPSCGTGGFFLGALNFLRRQKRLTESQKKFLKFETFHGWEIETSTARLCLMNLYLHGIGDLKKTPDISVTDSLKQIPKQRMDIVVANPPFGKSSSDIPTPDKKLAEKEGYFYRPDFKVTTGNKQLAFVQHIITMLKETGRAAVVLPDNVLFEGGAGEQIRRLLLDDTNLHTILRLPTGIFYANGVKSNVLFFDKKAEGDTVSTKSIWYYDYRTNIRHTLKKTPLKEENLQDFILCYQVDDISQRKETWSDINPEGRWKRYNYNEIISRDRVNLDIFWLKDEAMINIEDLPEPELLAAEIADNLRAGLESFEAIIKELERGN